MICPNCGSSNRAGARFCRVCGATLDNNVEVEETQVVAETAPAEAPVSAEQETQAESAPETEQAHELSADTTTVPLNTLRVPWAAGQLWDGSPAPQPVVSPAVVAQDDQPPALPQVAPVLEDQPTSALPEVAPVIEDDPTAALPEAAPILEDVPTITLPEVAPILEDVPTAVLPEAAPIIEDEPTAALPQVAPVIEDEPTAALPEVAPVADEEVVAEDSATISDDEPTAALSTLDAPADDTTSSLGEFEDVEPEGNVDADESVDTTNTPDDVIVSDGDITAEAVAETSADEEAEAAAEFPAPWENAAPVEAADEVPLARDELSLAGGYAAAESEAPEGEATTDPADTEPDQTTTAPTEAQNTMATHSGRETRKLQEDDAEQVVAPTPPDDPFPPLKEGELVGGRYHIGHVIQTGPQRQTYLASDEKGYIRCWACGSKANEAGESYCTDCGAQLSGRVYRLYEAPANIEPEPLPAALSDASIPAVATVAESFVDEVSGRHYRVVEEVGGRPLSDLVADANESRPSPERVLNWITQAADLLMQLQKGGAIGCDFSPESLQVLPDERIIMSDPVSCRVAPPDGEADLAADTQRVAAGLEQLFLGLSGLPMDKTPAYNANSGKPEDLAAVLRHGREGNYKTAAEFSGAIRDLFDVLVPPRDLQLISGRATDVGVQRELNEDSLLVLEFLAMEAAGSLPVGIYIVADGMGGHQSGEVASSIAIRTVGSILQNRVLAGQVTGEDHLPDPERMSTVLREAVLEANRRIVDLGRQRKSDMGTTITLALIIGNQVTIANVGDSRTYLWREERLQQVSRDHSLVARLVAAGQLSAEESRYFERRNEIYLALGDAALTADQIDVFHRTLRPLDGFLMCSDGLWEMVPDVQIERILNEAPNQNVAAQNLVNAANQNGGEDNISVVIARGVITEAPVKAKPNV